MKVTAIRTDKIRSDDADLFRVLDRYVKTCDEGSIVVVTSKIVSICEGRIVPIGSVDKDKLIAGEAELVIPRGKSLYNTTITITRGMLVAAAGIDESNGNGFYILWPEDPQKSANEIRMYLKKKFSLTNVGVIITDSKTTPLRWGTTGVALAHSGFAALKNYIGTPDIFNRHLKMTKSNVLDALAASAVLLMGEGNEQTPLAIIEDVAFVEFQDRNPTEQELKDLIINPKDDLYEPILTPAPWSRGRI